MRICFLAETYPTVTETFIYESVDWLERAGHHVSVVAAVREELPGGDGSRLACCTLDARGRRRVIARAILKQPLVTARTVVRLLSARRRRRFWLSYVVAGALLDEVRLADVVMAHFGPTGQLWLPVASVTRRRFAVYFHGYDVGAVLRQHPDAYTELFASGAALLTNSKYLKGRLLDAGAPEERLAVVRLGVYPDLAGKSSGPATPGRLLTVGRLVPKKGIEDSIRAFAAARPRMGPEWSYDIVGDGPLRPSLERLVQQEGLGPWIRFLGFLPRSETLTALREASLFVLSSKVDGSGNTEGTPVAIMEAATLGVPIVATRHAGIPEILPPDASARGFVVPEGDVPALASALSQLASSETMRSDWGAACARHARATYSAAVFTAALVATLDAKARIPLLVEAGRAGVLARPSLPLEQ
jgi:colanic acid/amylovoran/stewartan biosynthesis glycosyltransferase WcaL/AmsK/CpsK